jgi:predicted dehydrogenase
MNILIIGLGSIGQRHLRNLKKISPKAQIYVLRKKFTTPALDDSNKIINCNLKEKYAIKYIKNLTDIIKNKINLDCALVCTPSSQHVAQAIWLIKNNINCFVEKPLGSSLKRIDELRSLLKKKDKIITMMGFQMRFNPVINYLKKIIKNSIIGKILTVNIHNGENLADFHLYEDYKISYAARKELGGGVLLSQIHEIDYMLHLFEDYKITNKYSINSKISDLKINVEDIFLGNFFLTRNKQKILCTLNLNFFERPKKRTINIIGTKGSLEACLNKNKITIITNKKKRNINFNFNRNQIFIDELNFFISRVINKKKINKDMSLLNGIKTLKFALKLKRPLITR